MTCIDLTSDRDVLFGTIAGEAEGEPLIGKQAVAASIMKRVSVAKTLGRKQFGDGTIRGACLAHMQYDVWLPGPDHDRVMAIDLDNLSPAQRDCMAVAEAAIAGTLDDPTKGAAFYYQRDIPAPAWVAGAIFAGLFGSQLFWRGVK